MGMQVSSFSAGNLLFHLKEQCLLVLKKFIMAGCAICDGPSAEDAGKTFMSTQKRNWHCGGHPSACTGMHLRFGHAPATKETQALVCYLLYHWN
jgi:hypothetical protein